MDCLIFCLTEIWGGIEKNVVVRAEGLQKRGYKVAVVILENTFEQRFSDKGIRVFTVPKGGRFRVGTRLAVSKLVKEVHPKAVFSVLKADWWIVAAAAYRHGVKSTVLYLGVYRRLKENIKYRFLFRVFNAQLVVNSQSLYTSVIHSNCFLSESNVHLVHNGFKVVHVSPINSALKLPELPEDAFIIGCVGRLSPTKQYDRLARVLPLLPENFIVLLVGEGSEKENIQRKLAKAAVASRVFFMGQLPYESMNAFFSKLDVFLHISRLEGMANVLNEALSNGVPVVSTRVSGTDEVTDNGRFGIVTEIDDFDALAEGVLAISRGEFKFDPEEARQWIAQNFSMENMITKTERVLFANSPETLDKSRK